MFAEQRVALVLYSLDGPFRKFRLATGQDCVCSGLTSFLEACLGSPCSAATQACKFGMQLPDVPVQEGTHV